MKKNEEIKIAGRAPIGMNVAKRWTKASIDARRKYLLDYRAKEEYLTRTQTGEQYA
jgi:hypothetical protein